MADMNMDGGMPAGAPAAGGSKKVALVVVAVIVIALIAYFATRGGSATPADTTVPASDDASVNVDADLPNIDQAVPGTLATSTPAATGTGVLR